MVTAVSFGLDLSDCRHRAASTISAIESGPPDTASTSTGKRARPKKSDLASAAVTGAASAVHTLLFARHAALHGRRGAWKFAPDFGKGGTGRFLLMERCERLAETQQ